MKKRLLSGMPSCAMKRLWWTSLLVATLACGSGGSSGPIGGAAPGAEGGPADPPNEAGSPDPGSADVPTRSDFAAFSPAQPQLVSLGGPVLTHPRFQVISYDGDPNREPVEALINAIGSSSYWSATTAEYGVGPAIALTPVHLGTAPPSAIDEAQISANLAKQIGAGELAANDGQTAYVVLFPSSTTVTRRSESVTECIGEKAFHTDIGGIPFVVLPTCAPAAGVDLSPGDAATRRVSHEIIEAATDPFIYTNPAYSRTDDEHFAYWQAYGWESSDMCGWSGAMSVRSAELAGALVSRSWSNRFAAVGRHPCVPGALAAPYFNSVAVLPDAFSGSIAVEAQGLTWSFASKAVRIPVGQTKTVTVQLFSDAAIGDWTVEAVDLTGSRAGTSYLRLSLDKTSGKNGDTLQLEIKAIAAPPGGSPAVFTINSAAADGRVTRSAGMVVN